MKLRLELRPYRLALGQSVSNSQRSWRERAGVLLEISDEHGLTGQGEAAPLPGYAAEDLAAVERALAPHAGRVFDAPEPGAVASFAAGLTQSSAARFGLEAALFDWCARRRGEPLYRLLRALVPCPPLSASLPLAALIDADSKSGALDAARAALAAGFRTLKLKIGRPGAFAAELDTIAALSALDPALRLRLDANRAFPLAVGLERLRELAAFHPEFVEEPFEGGASLPANPELPLALDESIAEGRPLSRDGGVVAAVLKPGLLGGVARTLELAAEATRAGIAPIISHAFEGPVGFSVCCEIALASASTAFAAGLAPHPGLSAWKAPLPAAIDGATLVLHEQAGLGLPRIEVPA